MTGHCHMRHQLNVNTLESWEDLYVAGVAYSASIRERFSFPSNARAMVWLD